MHARSLALALLAVAPAVVPAVAGAQITGTRTSSSIGKTTLDDPNKGGGPTMASAGEIGKLDPISALLDKRKDLALSDSQVARLTEIQQKLRDDNEPALTRYDSVRHELRGAGGGTMTDEERQRFTLGRMALTAQIQQVQEHNGAAEKEALALLTADQQGKAAKILDKQHEKFENALKPRGGGGGGGRPAGPADPPPDVGGGRRRP